MSIQYHQKGSLKSVVLWLACWPLVPKFAGSNPAEAVGFFGWKNPQHAFLRRGNKASVPCRTFAACKRSRHLPWKSHAVGKIGSAISRPYFLPSLIEISHVAGRGVPLEMTGETKSGEQRARSYSLGASGLQGPGSVPTLLYSTLLYSTLLYSTLLYSSPERQCVFSQSVTCCLFEGFKVDLLSVQRQENVNCKGNLHLLFFEIHFVLTQATLHNIN
jgi:hypothetical protein